MDGWQRVRTGGRGMGGRRAGAILLVAMWVLFFLAGLVLVFGRSARTVLLASANETASIRAGAAERAGEQYAIAFIDQQADSVLYIDQTYFAAMPVGDNYFWIVRPNYGDTWTPSLGLVDEASKLNLNTATETMLSALPGMTQDTAAAIIDWRDSDSDVTQGGAEDQYYLTLPFAYTAKNSTLETVEELLLVKGVTPELLYGTGFGSRYGADTSWGLNGTTVQTDRQLGRGIYDLVTVYSSEPSTASSGGGTGGTGGSGGAGGAGGSGGPGGAGGGGASQGIDVNNTQGRNQVLDLLRQVLGNSRAEELEGKIEPRPAFKDVFDFGWRLRLTATEFDSLYTKISTGSQKPSTGLINILTAPQDVLLCLPGLTDSDVTQLVSSRLSVLGTSSSTLSGTSSTSTGSSSGSKTGSASKSGSGSSTSSTGTSSSGLGWVLEALGEKSAGLYNLITTRSYQYSADIIGVSGDGKAFRRCRVVIDARTSPPKIVYRRDMTQTGWPLDPTILVALREGLDISMAYGFAGGGL